MKTTANTHIKPITSLSLGTTGYSVTALRCTGFVLINDTKYEAESLEGMIPSGSQVIIIGWNIGRLLVKRIRHGC